ncbi:MAG TPA: fumarylacetoacetate hydrolase family protein [Solirubrobacteraceae bacterium]|nr:fumarylacetoacetate hydrolase family protein [Solirubrobacteraceae bacterium]
MSRVAKFADAEGVFWGIIDGTVVHRLRGSFEDWAPMLGLGVEADYERAPVPLSQLRLLAPCTPPARIFCFGLTYPAHAERLEHVLESSSPEPRKAPGAFLKPLSSLIDPEAEITYPPTTSQLDFEIEAVVVVAAPLSRDAPGDSILGYTVGNDVSARDAKNRSGGSDFFSMKALDRTAPLGPWITTRDVLGTAPDLELRLTVNAEVRQHDRTSNLIWSFEELLMYVDERVALRAGDLVFTGTPSGVAWEDGRFLEPDDVIEARIEGIGTLRNRVGRRRGQARA